MEQHWDGRASARGSGARASLSLSATCLSEQQTLYDIRESVTFKPTLAVVFPLAIYE